MIISKATDLLTLCARRRIKVLLKGKPGVGKTDLIRAVASACNMDLIMSHPSVSDPTDYKGLPVALAGKKGEPPTADFVPFGEMWRLIHAERPTIHFADDLGQAPHAVQAAYMQSLQSREVAGHKISPHVTFWAATNDTSHKAGVNALLEPVKSRFHTIIELDPSVDDWVTWALNNDMPAELVGFIRFRPDLLCKFEPTRELTNSPSPRTAANCGDLFNAGIRDMEVFAGAAGAGFAAEFVGFCKVFASLPDLDQIFMDPMGSVVPTDPATLFAVSAGVVKKISKDNADRGFQYMGRMPKEYEICTGRDAMRVHKDWLKIHPAYMKWCLRNAEHLG
jgi:hypothetical protein